MRMVCPACSAAYDVPETLLAPGRAVRCARCGHEWVPVAPPPPLSPAAPPVPEPPPPPRWPDGEVIEEVELEPVEQGTVEPPRLTAMDRLALHRDQQRRSRAPLRIAWLLSLLALLALGAAAYQWRAEVMHAWPASQRLYDTLGLHHTSPAAPQPGTTSQ